MKNESYLLPLRYINKHEIPAQWLIGFTLQGFEYTGEMRSVSKSLPLNQWEGIFFPVLQFALDVADPNRKEIKIHSIPQVY